MLQAVDIPLHKHAALVAEFQVLRIRQWDISVSHIYREANRSADYLANLDHFFCIGLHLFSFPDPSLAH
ncbi:hypothetical protein LINPERHAP2_LOCUS37113 [Linum perenne]